MLNTVKQSQDNYENEQKQARIRDEKLRVARQTNRSDFNYATLANSTPIRGNNVRTDLPGVHFNNNPMRHVYSTTSTTNEDNQYEPPANNSILQGALIGRFTTNTTDTMDRNDPWRCNIGISTSTHRAAQDCATKPTSCSGYLNSSPNSSDTRNGTTCFKCGEQGHIRLQCRERVYCTLHGTHNYGTKACRKQHNDILNPTSSHLTMGYNPTAMPQPLIGTTTTRQQTHQTGNHNNRPLFQNFFANNQQEPALQFTCRSTAHHQQHQST